MKKCKDCKGGLLGFGKKCSDCKQNKKSLLSTTTKIVLGSLAILGAITLKKKKEA